MMSPMLLNLMINIFKPFLIYLHTLIMSPVIDEQESRNTGFLRKRLAKAHMIAKVAPLSIPNRASTFMYKYLRPRNRNFSIIANEFVK